MKKTNELNPITAAIRKLDMAEGTQYQRRVELARIVFNETKGKAQTDAKQGGAEVTRIMAYADKAISVDGFTYAHLTRSQQNYIWDTVKRAIRALVMPNAVVEYKARGKDAEPQKVKASSLLDMGASALQQTATQMVNNCGQSDKRNTNGTKKRAPRLPESGRVLSWEARITAALTGTVKQRKELLDAIYAQRNAIGKAFATIAIEFETKPAVLTKKVDTRKPVSNKQVTPKKLDATTQAIADILAP